MMNLVCFKLTRSEILRINTFVVFCLQALATPHVAQPCITTPGRWAMTTTMSIGYNMTIMITINIIIMIRIWNKGGFQKENVLFGTNDPNLWTDSPTP